MLYYLDTNIVIYAVEGKSPFQQRARDQSPGEKLVDNAEDEEGDEDENAGFLDPRWYEDDDSWRDDEQGDGESNDVDDIDARDQFDELHPMVSAIDWFTLYQDRRKKQVRPGAEIAVEPETSLLDNVAIAKLLPSDLFGPQILLDNWSWIVCFLT